MAMKKKAAAAEPAGESAPMWIVSFADLVTLMMSFFVVLYALKQGGEKQQIDTMAAVKVAFNPSYIPPDDSPLEWQMAVRRAEGVVGPAYQNAGGVATQPTQGAEGTADQVTTILPGKQIVTGGKLDFDANKTDLDSQSLATIHQIAAKLQGFNNILFVKGHVSAEELALRPDDPEGLMLSYARAMKVIDELVKLGIDRRVMRPIACGAYEPRKVGAYDEASQRENRRVEVFATENTASDFSPVQTVPATGKSAESQLQP